MKKAHLHSCNILEVDQQARHFWHFSVSGGQVKLSQEQTIPVLQTFPKAAAKSIFERRLNIAWLSGEQVFVRAVRLPAVERPELISRIEFQLEKLSPFPVNQIVWSMEVLPGVVDGQQTVVVIIAARDAVETFLGKLEADKYLPDRLELPQLHQLLTTPMDADGAWLYPTQREDRILCLIAWCFGGVLQQVQLIYLPNSPDSASPMVEQLNKISWAGEMEGWLPGPTRWHLVAESELSAKWESALNQWAGEAVTIHAPPSRTALAELAARRAAHGESHANLLPAEHAQRYRQQFVDRLWMTGLAAMIGTYVAGVLIYFGVLYGMRWQRDRVLQQVKALSTPYTNAIKLKEKIDVLQSQLDLKYAALDAFKAVSENLPEGVSLTSFTFSRGKTLRLDGNAPLDQAELLTKFAKDLREATVDGQKIFTKVPVPDTRRGLAFGGGQQMTWILNCELQRTDSE